ncbi:class I SAM-dependent methyltransferase [Anaerocolumna sp. MB42-C2]|uniref:class I SAM-dependent methyltransferase n=1 Tax=Anaerocolumna sp. MB42-C2 TaxID=3070997 RepID=UPI0027DFCEFC|nr:methyltransferase [Anaerocolumna sp. MB42-C2]WMJ89367.1 methyltransferase [Anaerocolumna sp. MB42-C2]
MIITEIKGITLKFETDDKLFSPSAIDMGTITMLTQIEFQSTDKILDLGCGYGVVGILASKLIGENNVTLCDFSDDAIRLSRINADINEVPDLKIIKSNGLENIIDNDFTLILSNPPYHVDFSVPKQFIEMGFKKLTIGGKMVMVTKRKDWYKNKLTSIFGGTKVINLNGYYVFIAEKRLAHIPIKSMNTNHLSKKLQRKQRK